MQEVLHNLIGTYSNNCTPKENSQTRRQTVLEQDCNVSYILLNMNICIFAIVHPLHERVNVVLAFEHVPLAVQ